MIMEEGTGRSAVEQVSKWQRTKLLRGEVTIGRGAAEFLVPLFALSPPLPSPLDEGRGIIRAAHTRARGDL